MYALIEVTISDLKERVNDKFEITICDFKLYKKRIEQKKKNKAVQKEE